MIFSAKTGIQPSMTSTGSQRVSEFAEEEEVADELLSPLLLRLSPWV
jgi:hypothetical protein